MVIDGKTGYVFPSGDVDALADAIVKIGGVSAEAQAAMAKAGKEMVFAEHRTNPHPDPHPDLNLNLSPSHDPNPKPKPHQA